METEKTQMATYKEHIGRYRIVFHEEYSDAVKAELRISGIDPDAHTTLYWSSNDLYDADCMLAECQKRAPAHKTYWLEDNGTEEFVERQLGGMF
jgi:hypothetical protein